MSKLADTLRKEGWKLTPCDKLKPGDYAAVMHSLSSECEGTIADVADNENGTFTVFYGECGVVILSASAGALWLAPKEYEHLEKMWSVNGDVYVNVSPAPHEPYFVHASYIYPERYRHISPQTPDRLLKEKP